MIAISNWLEKQSNDADSNRHGKKRKSGAVWAYCTEQYYTPKRIINTLYHSSSTEQYYILKWILLLSTAKQLIITFTFLLDATVTFYNHTCIYSVSFHVPCLLLKPNRLAFILTPLQFHTFHPFEPIYAVVPTTLRISSPYPLLMAAPFYSGLATVSRMVRKRQFSRGLPYLHREVFFYFFDTRLRRTLSSP